MKRTVIIVLGAIGVVIISLSIALMSGYNKLVDGDESISYQYSLIDARLEQRYATLTQLANAVNGFQAHEQFRSFEAITNARAAYAAAKAQGDLEGMIEADNLQSIALTDLLALFEDNEELQASDAYGDYMDAVRGIESALTEARRQHNLAVQEYNLYVRKFPGLMYAAIFSSFPDVHEYWKASAGSVEIPDIVFGSQE